ncbi:MAG: hypothetical protein LC754_07715, partial [Acidobacteria bacterium]|nr:hypothetical protein [Acidobacteriota bacterium]
MKTLTGLTIGEKIIHMRRLLSHLAIMFLTFYFGSWVNLYVHEIPSNLGITDCACTGVRCRVLFVVDSPITAITHPKESWEMLRT